VTAETHQDVSRRLSKLTRELISMRIGGVTVQCGISRTRFTRTCCRDLSDAMQGVILLLESLADAGYTNLSAKN
jgi:hypothetical protein